MALRAVLDHPKFADLKARLQQPRGAALGWLEAIWHFAGRFTPQGNIGKYSDVAIEAWVEWNGEPGRLIAVLIETKWIDMDSTHRLLVHDWAHHADKATKTALGRAHLQFCSPTVHTLGTHVSKVAPAVPPPFVPPAPEPVPEPVPEPEPGAGPEPLPPEPIRPNVVPFIPAPDPDAGAELPLANWLLEEIGVPADPSLIRVVGGCIRLWAKENAVTMQESSEWIHSQAVEQRCRGETINRFWFSDQRYRPVTGKTRKQADKEARRKAFIEGG